LSRCCVVAGSSAEGAAAGPAGLFFFSCACSSSSAIFARPDLKLGWGLPVLAPKINPKFLSLNLF
jgi:hypothetical protein